MGAFLSFISAFISIVYLDSLSLTTDSSFREGLAIVATHLIDRARGWEEGGQILNLRQNKPLPPCHSFVLFNLTNAD